MSTLLKIFNFGFFLFFFWAIPGLFFFIFVFSTHSWQKTNVHYINKFCRWLDSNRGPLVLEATALPTEPQPLPNFYGLFRCLCRCGHNRMYLLLLRINTRQRWPWSRAASLPPIFPFTSGTCRKCQNSQIWRQTSSSTASCSATTLRRRTTDSFFRHHLTLKRFFALSQWFITYVKLLSSILHILFDWK